jgi:eukaryotic-like serine/threonine-protein kinase
VFLGRRDGLERRFAIKVTDGRFAEAKEIERFRREAHVASKLEHRGIVGVFDVGQDGGRHFYAMEYVEGPTLEDHLKGAAPLMPDEAVELLEALAEAIHFAHERRVIHRDLKPANVLLNANNEAFVLDFGLAKLSDESLELTKTGAALGTPYYMAPEQIKSPKDVDTRVDVFALGVILYELMTGVRPFQGQTAGEVTHKIINTEPPPPSTLSEKLRPALDAIVFKAIEKDAEVRYQTVDELRREVAKYRRGDRVRDAGDVAQLKAKVRRYWAANMAPLLVGFFIASAVYLPWIYLLLS